MSETKPTSSEPSQIAGRYQIVKKLGAGAFGTVYKAKDKVLGRMVAIKTIRLEGLAAAGASIEELVERFGREARVSAQLKHPNIVTIYDVGESEGMSYLAMEFIDGVGLDRVIASAGRLPAERAGSIGVQIADALDFAHKHGVVHRDIKPANIMIEAGDRVKVTDFGIAKELSGEHLTMTGSLLGTPSYMSPEQARGAQLDGRSDLFAVGCILYEMLAGQKAFRGDSITGLIFKIITEEPPPIRALDPDIPEEMVRIIARALSKAPETRYQNGKELADDLAQFTHPGSTPTIRQAEAATSPGIAAAAPPTAVASVPTMNITPTVAVPGAATRVAAPPTQVSAPTRVSPPPRPAAAPAAAPASASAPAVATPRPGEAPRKSASAAGLLIGLGLVGLLFMGGVAGAGWYFFLRKPPAPAAASGATTAPEAAAPAALPATAGGAPAGGAPAGGTEAATATAPAAPAGETALAAPRESAPRETGRAGAAPARSKPAEGAGGAPAPRAAEAEPSAEHSFLDEEPAEQADGTEAGQRLAQSYRSDQGGRSGSSFGTGSRFRPRERSPRNLGPVERPAVAALRHVMNAEELYKRKHGRYGSFAELASARTLFLDVPLEARAFVRKSYRFELTLEEDGFKVMAMPAGPGPRPFIGDETGFIREGLE